MRRILQMNKYKLTKEVGGYYIIYKKWFFGWRKVSYGRTYEEAIIKIRNLEYVHYVSRVELNDN